MVSRVEEGRVPLQPLEKPLNAGHKKTLIGSIISGLAIHALASAALYIKTYSLKGTLLAKIVSIITPMLWAKIGLIGAGIVFGGCLLYIWLRHRAESQSREVNRKLDVRGQKDEVRAPESARRLPQVTVPLSRINQEVIVLAKEVRIVMPKLSMPFKDLDEPSGEVRAAQEAENDLQQQAVPFEHPHNYEEEVKIAGEAESEQHPVGVNFSPYSESARAVDAWLAEPLQEEYHSERVSSRRSLSADSNEVLLTDITEVLGNVENQRRDQSTVKRASVSSMSSTEGWDVVPVPKDSPIQSFSPEPGCRLSPTLFPQEGGFSPMVLPPAVSTSPVLVSNSPPNVSPVLVSNSPPNVSPVLVSNSPPNASPVLVSNSPPNVSPVLVPQQLPES